MTNQTLAQDPAEFRRKLRDCGSSTCEPTACTLRQRASGSRDRRENGRSRSNPLAPPTPWRWWEIALHELGRAFHARASSEAAWAFARQTLTRHFTQTLEAGMVR